MPSATLKSGLSQYEIGAKIRSLRLNRKMGLVELEFFFAGAREKPVALTVRKSARVRLPERPGTRQVSYRFESLITRRRNDDITRSSPSFFRSGRTISVGMPIRRRIHLRAHRNVKRPHQRRGTLARCG